jgi:hypothetical protein
MTAWRESGRFMAARVTTWQPGFTSQVTNGQERRETARNLAEMRPHLHIAANFLAEVGR